MPDSSSGPENSRSSSGFEIRAPLAPDEAEIGRVHHQFDASQRLSEAALRRWQLAQLGRLLAHARAHVPFYADSLHPFSSNTGQSLDESAWRALPILSKAQVRAESSRLRATSLAPGVRVFSKWTTGSTGVPLEVLTTSDYWPLFRAIKLRLLQWHRCDPRGKMCEILPVAGPNVQRPLHRMPQWEWPFGVLFATGEQLRVDVFTDVATQLAILETEAPDYLVTFPSNLRLLLHELQRTGKTLPSLRVVRTLSETLDPELRLECRRILGVPVMDSYGSRECGYMAIQCPEHEHYHVQSELNFIEILRDDGTPCEPGEVGRVVATPLHAFAMPLLRYDIGDYAEVGGPCPCGRGLPVLRRIVGRTKEVLTLPSGERRYAFYAGRAFRGIAAVKQFRIIEKARGELEVQIAVERPLEPHESDQISAELAKQTGPGFSIRLVFVESIPRLPGGKHMDFISEVEPAA